ncbi:MAG: thioredoxin family protein [Candidatus Marinimicrobia bacterium]|nr:thioredoxin family protein [Candidatus Neomarinimicrobiota bacterium]
MKSQNKKRLFTSVIAVVILVVGLLLMGCSGKKDTVEVKTSVEVKTVAKLPKMVDFWSPTCPPCKAMLPILAELHEEYAHAFDLVKVDVSLTQNQQRAVQNQIQYIPTQIFYDENGKQIFRHTGFLSKQQILDKWRELGYDMSPKAKD